MKIWCQNRPETATPFEINKNRLRDRFRSGLFNHRDDFGLSFRLFIADAHINLRYNIVDDVYDGSDGFAEIQFKVGTAF